VAERLEDGWQPDTPVGDTLFRDHFMGFADYAVAAGHAGGHPTIDDDALAAADGRIPHPFVRIAVLRRPPTDVEATADRLDAFFSGDGLYGVFVPGLAPLPRGYVLGGHPPFMIRAAGGSAPPVPTGLRIERVGDEQRMHEFEGAMVRGYPVPELVGLPPGTGFPTRLFDEPDLQLWVGYEDDHPVATAGALVHHGLNHVEWISAIPEVRGRGYGAAMTWKATLADPSLPAALIASDDGRPVYDRMGYLPVARCTFWTGPRR
jgi:hypothetical protein